MADVRAFRGVRYDLGRVGRLADVVCPPYDVIDPALQERLYAASPYNAVRLEWPRRRPDGPSPYEQAAAALREWLLEGVLRQDTARSLYIYEQEFEVGAQTLVRRGFFARVRLEPFGRGRIFPHEQTLRGPKEDRLQLYRATGFNLSPVFGLYPDPAGEVWAELEPFTRSGPPLEAVDHLGVRHRLWTVTDSRAISRVIGLMGPRPIYIADGHHRYETGLKYLEELEAAGDAQDPEHPARFCLMALVGMSDPGLVILPTHRLVRAPRAISATELAARLQPQFDLLATFPRLEDASQAWEYIELDGSQQVMAFGVAGGTGSSAVSPDGPSEGTTWQVVRLRDPQIMAKLAPEHCPQWRELSVSVLHRLVLGQLLPEELFGGPPQLLYVHQWQEAVAALAEGSCQLAVLLPPATMEHLVAIAEQGQTMPPKSTYFYPKLLTGLVFHSLRHD